MAEAGANIDLKAHEGTYARFIGLAKTGSVICAVIAAFVIFLITR
jgi:hypothetical protein